MTISQRFAAYAFAFEKAYLSDDWTELGAFFAEDAVYEVHDSSVFRGVWRGRDAIVDQLKESVTNFDRRCDSRSVELVSLKEGEEELTVTYRGRYKLGGEELLFEGSETAHFRDDAILRLVDRFPPESVEAIEDFVTRHKLRS